MNKEIKTISPFKNFCITIGALPTSYLESMSYYEMLCWLCKYLENTINPAINNNAEALQELQDYVAHYFDNLDVTEEINNKLDEMVEDGTMAEIINQEIFTTLNNKVSTLEDDVKLSNSHPISLAEITGDTSIIDEFISGYIAWNDNSTWFKCFLYMTITSDGSNKSITIPLPEGFTVAESYYINYAGELYNNGAFIGGAALHITPSGIQIPLVANGTYTVKFNPYCYYNDVIEVQ